MTTGEKRAEKVFIVKEPLLWSQPGCEYFVVARLRPGSKANLNPKQDLSRREAQGVYLS